jgi:hypothetical protein
VTGVHQWNSGLWRDADPGSLVETQSEESPLLQIELLEDTSGGCVARMTGHLVGDTAAALWSIEPMMANETRVVLDLSGVVTIDSAGFGGDGEVDGCYSGIWRTTDNRK